jgi:L-lactate dehydrogenase complex protein LldG
MDGREAILGRIRGALRDVPAGERPGDLPLARGYRERDEAPRAEILGRFAERVAEYKARVRVVTAAELPATIAAALRERGVERLVVPADLPEGWLPEGVTLLRDQGQLTYEELDASDGVLTGCALGVAQTGTIVLDHGPGQGRRALSLLPDYHLCVVYAAQVVGLVPEAIGGLGPAAHERRPLTFISGPSATSDIELNRVEGVHGPRTLEVLIVSEGTGPEAPSKVRGAPTPRP